MIKFETAKNFRSRDISKHIDFDVLYKDIWIPYTATPNDPVSKDMYLSCLKEKINISPGDGYEWLDGSWKKDDNFAQRVIESEKAERQEKIKTLTSSISALSDKIEFGMSTDVEEDKERLLAMRKERASLI